MKLYTIFEWLLIFTIQVAQGKIEYQSVEFRYPTRREVKVLQGLSLVVPSSKRVALVGPSGCGKSTLIQLLQRLYDPDDGAVVCFLVHLYIFTKVQFNLLRKLTFKYNITNLNKINIA